MSLIARPIIVVLASAQRRGAEIQGAGLASLLVARGHDASAVALELGTGADALDVPVLGESARSVPTLRSLRRLLSGAVVVAHGSTTLPAVAIATLGTRTPWVYRSIGDPQAWVRGPLHRARTAALLARADRVVTLWDGSAASIRSLYRVAARRLVVIPNSRSPAHFPPISPAERVAVRRAYGVDGPVVLYLGALSEEKRPLDAVRAVAALAGVTLIVAGRGPLAADVEELAARIAPGRVRLVGETSDPAGLLAVADAVVLPSRTEGMPGVIIEAMMRGVPVVATAVGAVPIMVREGVDGFVVAPSEPASLGSALAVVLADPERFRGRGIETACEQFGQDAVVTRWEDVLAEVTGERAPRSDRPARS